MTERYYLACDLGAESGRLMLGTLAAGRLALEELHRFPNTPVKSGESIHWNIEALFRELKAGLLKAGQRGLPFAGISTDSWGVDYLLFGRDRSILAPTFHYRDPRTQRGVDNAFSKLDPKTIFAETGIQFMPLNTLFQLAAETPERLRRAALILGIGDGFNYLLGGKAVAEQSMASTFQLFNPRTHGWSQSLIQALGFPTEIFPPLVPSGTRLGPLRPELAKESGLSGVEVVASCSHDTGAAVAAVPANGEHWAYLSSGTWSLMGVERSEPVINELCQELNFTNEVGYGSSIRLLKNIIGLWLVQECRRDWAQSGHEYDYATLTQLAAQAPPFVSLINPADQRFLRPDRMPAKIAEFCRETGQAEPGTPGAMIRCILESLALLYRRTFLQLERLTGRKIERLHIVGGGSKNELLNQFSADALQVPVLAGPVEATAAGNVLVQALALGDLPDLKTARQVINDSMGTRLVEPGPAGKWGPAYERFSAWWTTK
jgi:rhamnulokinase